MPPRLLILSNGHGEDLIAARVAAALHTLCTDLELAALPLVGVGAAYAGAEKEGWLHRIGPRQPLPSGGFSNQSLGGLAADLRAGLPLLSWRQWRTVHRWGRSGAPLLAVGDLLPLLLAWAAGGPYGFIGTPKSDYTWRSPSPAGWGGSPIADRYHRCKGSEWDPWEWSLMAHRRCRMVAVRDRLTARGLRHHGVRACAPGNPMVEGFGATPLPACLAQRRRLLLLPGSRVPEAGRNLQRLLTALPTEGPAMAVLAATASRPTPEELVTFLHRIGFRPERPPQDGGAAAAWRRASILLLIGPGRFSQWAPWAELGLATAGTATEQLVSLGIPALSLPGAGPQFRAGFARRQSRLLGGAVLPCHSPGELRQRMLSLLRDDAGRARLGRRGRSRMGAAGGSARLARLIDTTLLAPQRSDGEERPRGG